MDYEKDSLIMGVFDNFMNVGLQGYIHVHP